MLLLPSSIVILKHFQENIWNMSLYGKTYINIPSQKMIVEENDYLGE